MKTICILTATRAEYGLLSPIIKALLKTKLYNVKVAVTGMHLSPEFGLTYKEIEKDGVEIDKKIPILLSSDDAVSISKTMALALSSFAEYFDNLKPDLLLVLGDRYETLAVCCAALNARIPIAHLYGGETTEGAIDEAVRHSITKMSYIHFTSTEVYRKRVIQLGESPDRVFSVGAIGIENILTKKLLSKEELEESIGWKLEKPFAIVTFHPVTLENSTARDQFEELLKAVSSYSDMQFIFTKANADADGRIINNMSDEFAKNHKNVKVYESLGSLRYLSAIKYCSFVMGNSSSGIVEVPSFHKPTINIGDRQKGRIQAESVINCKPEKTQIIDSINKALSKKFLDYIQDKSNPYGDGYTSEKIVKEINSFFQAHDCSLKKKFYDVEFSIDS